MAYPLDNFAKTFHILAFSHRFGKKSMFLRHFTDIKHYIKLYNVAVMFGGQNFSLLLDVYQAERMSAA